MPKNFVRKTFDRWIAHSAGRFHHPPRVVGSRREYFVLQFAGVTPAIRCVVKKKGTVGIYRFQGEESSRLVFMRQVYEVDVGLYIIYQGKTWDMLPDFDVFQRHTPTGHYYCDACTAPEMFPSRAAGFASKWKVAPKWGGLPQKSRDASRRCCPKLVLGGRLQSSVGLNLGHYPRRITS
jgi:hypothetical protein